MVVEKILEPGERLPESWPVAGTTGYDFTNRVGGLFVDPAGEEPLSEAYTSFTGESIDYDEVVYEKKHLVMSAVLSSEINRLTGLAIEACERHRRYRDYTRHDLHETLRELIAAFPVYRTYVVPGAAPSPDDIAHVDEAAKLARSRRPDLDSELFDFLVDILLGRHRGQVEDELVARFQQVTGPVMAKGVEDTTFYTYNRLVALNEVGGNPGRFGMSPEEFHADNDSIARHWPGTLLATSTHDTKRSEDTRARIALLSEIPLGFAEAVAEWSRLNERHRSDPSLPDRNAEWLLYQTLVGAWPLSAERAVAYMEKASKEAKEHTSWVDPDPDYDDALRQFVEGVVADEAVHRRARGVRRSAGRAGPGQLPGPGAAEADVARCARHLPGLRAVGPLPGRPRQPPPGRLRRPGVAAGRSGERRSGRGVARSGRLRPPQAAADAQGAAPAPPAAGVLLRRHRATSR